METATQEGQGVKPRTDRSGKSVRYWPDGPRRSRVRTWYAPGERRNRTRYCFLLHGKGEDPGAVQYLDRVLGG